VIGRRYTGPWEKRYGKKGEKRERKSENEMCGVLQNPQADAPGEVEGHRENGKFQMGNVCGKRVGVYDQKKEMKIGDVGALHAFCTIKTRERGRGGGGRVVVGGP